MYLKPILIILAVLRATRAAGDTAQCNVSSTSSCTCPSGATFANSTTFGFIGASACDIHSIMGDFFNTDWLELPVAKTRGLDNRVGALRWLDVTSNNSTYRLEEVLTIPSDFEGGAFAQAFHLVNTPLMVPEAQGGGRYEGYWVNIRAQQIQDNMSIMSWGVYRCVVGNPFDFTTFHEKFMVAISTILEAQGKLTGSSSIPVSVGDR